MVSSIAYHVYDLHFKDRRQTKGQGALLRYEFADYGVGFASLPAWPQFGDLTLADKLRKLRADPTLEPQCSWASLDARLRAEKKSALPDSRVLPRSHHHLTAEDLQRPQRLAELVAEGKRCWKIKITPSLLNSLPLARLASFVEQNSVKLRLDGNGSFVSLGELEQLFEMIPHVEIIHFFEDPSLDENLWRDIKQKWEIDLASDWVRARDHDLIIHKPTRDLVVEDTCDFVVTTAFDHPLGLNFTAYRSVQLQKHPRYRGPAGIVHPGLYNCDGLDSAVIFGGTGFGCDKLLEKIPWKPL